MGRVVAGGPVKVGFSIRFFSSVLIREKKMAGKKVDLGVSFNFPMESGNPQISRPLLTKESWFTGFAAPETKTRCP